MNGRHEDVGHEPENPRDEFFGPVLRGPHEPTGDRRPVGFRTGLRESLQDRQSALNLRIAFAVFGLVFSAGFAVLALWAELPALAAVLGLIAVVAAVNVVVVVRRRIRRGDGHPFFG